MKYVFVNTQPVDSAALKEGIYLRRVEQSSREVPSSLVDGWYLVFVRPVFYTSYLGGK